MHNVVRNARVFAHHLARRGRRLGVEIRTRTRAVELIGEDQRVVAVQCNKPAGPQRFGDELAAPGVIVPKQPYKSAFIVFDHTLARKFSRWPNYISTAPGISYAYLDDYRRSRKDIYRRGTTIEALAIDMGVPSQTLEGTIAAYDAAGRGARPPIETGPYYALGPLKSCCVFADGGLALDDRLAVLRADGSPIDGLFACGSTGQGGLLLEGHGHSLGWAFVSGRIAGRNAANHRATD